ncbi:DUF1254 domain-containing protein [Pseudomaricurvus alkylphenolicus]|jgi:DNA sulfur modification protein DndE|uniref:DUF1254 domain-containing protein n=1 Tax=Pseudomaricurvus alkylphenolicus TaxID=1306991 RepID=UPI001424058C|nr:DUF1254 domain-containing protein [Pseudomaricurvus alkylphenolicus]NIB39246.1 DUF1254 domain-containing protein [Pseudomaricurvus alkylphenolicus]
MLKFKRWSRHLLVIAVGAAVHTGVHAERNSLQRYTSENEVVDLSPDKSLRASTDPRRDERAKEELGYSLGMQAYTYGLPSLRFEEFRYGLNRMADAYAKRGMNSFSESSLDGAQFNEIVHVRMLSTPSLKLGITPNNDTMYSSCFYQLKDEPLVLTVPDIQDRYYSVQVVDGNLSNAAYIGTRATHARPGKYALVGPDWQGELPKGMTRIDVPTNEGFFALRILVDGAEDTGTVMALQDQFYVKPLSAEEGQKVVTTREEFPQPVTSGELPDFARIVDFAHRNPPQDAAGKAIWDSFKHIGLSLEQEFDPASLDPAIKRGMKRAIAATKDLIAWKVKYRGHKSQSMWNVDLVGGRYGQDYLARAEGAIQGLVVHSAAEGMYFHTYHDGAGETLNGSNNYTLTFSADHLPPVNAFWSLTGYTDDYNLVENDFRRYSIGDRTQGLTYNADGSLTLYIQSAEPKQGTSNWLPIPEGEMFRLNLRMYMPKPGVLDEASIEHYVPPVIRTEGALASTP